jgi:transcriptional regulator with XRE-family HTH domain
MESTELEDPNIPAVLPLTVLVEGDIHAVEPHRAPVIIGRPDPERAVAGQTDIRLPDDPRISRKHLVVHFRDDHWIAEATGRNGVFVDSQQVTGEIVIPHEGVTLTLGHPVSGIPVYLSTLEPANVYVGAQVAKRRIERDLSQRTLAANKVINAGALIAFEKGRSWPRDATRARLEEALRWPPGEIARLRRQFVTGSAATPEPTASVDEGERTELLHTGGTTTVESKYMAETVAMALENIQPQIATLPPPSDATFQDAAAGLIANLSRLEALATNASRGAVGAEEMFRALGAVRRTRRELMLRAAKSPHATVGQRLFAARHRADLSVAEAAAMAGLSPDDITAAEAGNAVAPSQLDALNHLLAVLQQ